MGTSKVQVAAEQATKGAPWAEQFSEFGNNPWPLATLDDGQCCDACNWVIPAPIAGVVAPL